MVEADLVALVKKKFRITGTELDDDFEEAVTAAMDILPPYAKKPVTDETVTVDSADSSFDLPGSLAGADLLYIFVKGSDDIWTKYSDYSKYDNTVYLRSYLDDATSVRLHVKVPYDDITEVPAVFKRPIVDMACSEFATVLAGSKTKYNIYAQSNGARAVDNMLDLADYYERKAIRQLERLSAGEVLG